MNKKLINKKLTIIDYLIEQIGDVMENDRFTNNCMIKGSEPSADACKRANDTFDDIQRLLFNISDLTTDIENEVNADEKQWQHQQITKLI